MLKADVLAPLDAYYDLYGWDKYLAGSATKHTIRDGKKWMVPLYLELPGIAFRPSVLKAYGHDGPPQTWDAFVAVLRAAKADGKVPLTVGCRGFSFVMLLQNMFWSAGDAKAAPLARPAIVTSLIFGFVWTWNDLFLPVVFLQNPALYTIPQGIISLRRDAYTPDYVRTFAAAIISTVPMIVLYRELARRAGSAITGGALKG